MAVMVSEAGAAGTDNNVLESLADFDALLPQAL